MTLCLNMIVRNESLIIAETLAHVLEHFPITSWVVHDTGSEDGTPEIVEDFFAARELPGKLVRQAWVDFGTNRQLAFEDAAGMAGHVLFFDADDRVEGRIPPLPGDCDSLTLNMKRDATIYPAKLIVRNNGTFRWRGVIHEGLYFTGVAENHRHLDGDYVIASRSEGARSRDASTYYRDARTLVQAIGSLAESDRDLLPRYTFYCANSWRDAQAPREAIAWYRSRIELGGWADEVYLSWLGLGIELEKVGEQEEAILAYLSGHDVCPDRAECLYHLVRLRRRRSEFETALLFARAGRQISLPSSSRLFVWADIYAYWMDFEYLSCLKALGRLEAEGGAAVEALRGSSAPRHLWDLLGIDVLAA